MISKLLVLAFVAAVATASEATEQAAYVVSVHDDTWCHSHHLGEGATHCVSNNGCCFSDKISKIFEVMSFDKRLSMDFGPCHSCKEHEDGWCEAFGLESLKGNVWDDCLANSGCTWKEEKEGEGICRSTKDEELVTVHNCATQKDDTARLAAFDACLAESEKNQEAGEQDFEPNAKIKTVRDLPTYRAFLHNPSVDCLPENGCGCMDLYAYTPVCTDTNEFAPYQSDSIPHVNGDKKNGQYFCVDKYGHEIPNTRKQEPLDTPGAIIDCDIFRRKHDGYQCPNAMVLSSSGGVVQVNEANDALDCRQDCANDKDCGDEGWCCFNGCAYTCQRPVKPFTGCANSPVHEVGQTLSAYQDDGYNHEMEVVASCKPGFSVAQNKGLAESVLLTCSHGHWLTGFGEENFELDCEQQCDPFNIEITTISTIDGLKMNRDDFVIEGDEEFFGSKRRITCVDNYGVVAGSDSVLKTGADVLECSADGKWEEKFTGNPRSIECSVCFDSAIYRDAQGNSCQHYQSRPAECLKGEIGEGVSWEAYTPAQKNCRVACRTCRDAEAQYGVKDTRKEADICDPEESGCDEKLKNWKKVAIKVIKTRFKNVGEIQKVTVTKHLPLSQACQKEGKPTMEAELIADMYSCDHLEEGYEIAGEAPESDSV